jgi:hypothetical protein
MGSIEYVNVLCNATVQVRSSVCLIPPACFSNVSFLKLYVCADVMSVLTIVTVVGTWSKDTGSWVSYADLHISRSLKDQSGTAKSACKYVDRVHPFM